MSTSTGALSPTEKTFQYTADDFERLYRQTHDKAYQMALRLTRNASDAEDLCQQSYVRAWSAFQSYRPSHPFLNWLLRIIHNVFCDEYRRRNALRNPISIDDIAGEDGEPTELPVADMSLDPCSMALLEEEMSGLELLLEDLPDTYRRVLIMRDIDGMSYAQIAEMSNETVATIRSRLHRGRQKLRELAEEHGFEPTYYDARTTVGFSAVGAAH